MRHPEQKQQLGVTSSIRFEARLECRPKRASKCPKSGSKALLHGPSACVKFATNSQETDLLASFHPGRFSVLPAGRNQ
jgi:hypothetical protein